jgi:hypothetical protein
VRAARELSAATLVLLVLSCAGTARAAESAALELESKIPLGNVSGRIDHLAVDVKRQRLYVAELGNDSVAVVDLAERKTLRTLAGLRAPQGIGYVPSTDTVYIANAGDGSVRLFEGPDLKRAGQISLGDDADNVRVDDAAHRVFVGYGSGALAVIDTITRTKVADIGLQAHPESFQLDGSGQRIFVNVPDAHEIAVVERAINQQISAWSTGALRANFPLAVDEEHHQVLTIFRHPAKLVTYDEQDGHPLKPIDTCADSDDVFVDSMRHRVYVSCGEGFVDVLAQRANEYQRIAHILTVAGARTSLFIPELDRFTLAVRTTATSSASIWVFRPGAVVNGSKRRSQRR